jgi:catecholate siderophore receptor
MRESVCRVPGRGGKVGIRSTARNPSVQAAIGIASAMMAGQAAAQDALPTIDVTRGGRSTAPRTVAAPAPAPVAAPAAEPAPAGAEGYRATSSGLSRIPTPLIDPPQTIDMVTQEVIRDQGARTMEDALRNVPGITFQSGEGGMQGDAPFIRGFQARTDIFRDGIRDPGWYTRDIFSSDSVEVFKGPSAFAFGRGSTGGAINITSKQATGAKFFEGPLSGSTPKGVRADIDASGSYANIDVRIAAVYQDIDTAGRDNVWTKRWGVAPSMTYKFNQESRLKLGYIYQGEESVPDYGHPYLPQAVRSAVMGQLTSTGQTTSPVPINRNNWFGTTSGPFADRIWTETHILTAAPAHFCRELAGHLFATEEAEHHAVAREALKRAAEGDEAADLFAYGHALVREAAIWLGRAQAKGFPGALALLDDACRQRAAI